MRYRLNRFTSNSNFLTGFVLLLALGASSAAHAATHTWTGGGSSANWSVGANWDVGVPGSGDSIAFPATSHTTSNNDLATTLAFNAITFAGSGYTVTGNQITVNSISTSNASGQNQISAALSSPALTVTSGVAGTTLLLGQITVAKIRWPLPATGGFNVSGFINGVNGEHDNGL